MNLSLERLWTDDDGMLEVDVRVSNGRQTSTMKVYVFPPQLDEFGAELESFPRDISQEVALECGARGPRQYGYFRMRVSFHPPSRAMIDVTSSVPDDQPDPFDCRFRVETEPAALNDLGRRLRGWARSDSRWLTYPPDPDD